MMRDHGITNEMPAETSLGTSLAVVYTDRAYTCISIGGLVGRRTRRLVLAARHRMKAHGEFTAMRMCND